MSKKLILNALGFNVLWFAWALGVPAGQVIVPAIVSILLFALHLISTASRLHDLRLMGICLIAGVIFDSLLQNCGWLRFNATNPTPLTWLQPWWMAFIWAAFACTLNHSMAWLGRLHWLLSAFICGVFGYLSYAGAAKLGALEIAAGQAPFIALFAFWAVFIPTVQRLRT